MKLNFIGMVFQRLPSQVEGSEFRDCSHGLRIRGSDGDLSSWRALAGFGGFGGGLSNSTYVYIYIVVVSIKYTLWPDLAHSKQLLFYHIGMREERREVEDQMKLIFLLPIRGFS